MKIKAAPTPPNSRPKWVRCKSVPPPFQNRFKSVLYIGSRSDQEKGLKLKFNITPTLWEIMKFKLTLLQVAKELHVADMGKLRGRNYALSSKL